MSAIEPLSNLINIKPFFLNKVEMFVLEAELFTRIYDYLKEDFRNQYKAYFHLMKFTTEMEDTMLELYFGRLIINDILSTEEYTLDGVARYIDTDKEIVESIFLANHSNPSALLIRKLIELHRNIRPNLYKNIMKKIVLENTAA